MAFAVTSNPARFDEAVDWFGRRVVLTQKQAHELGSDAGRRAFWVGGGLQLTQIQRVFDKVNKAVEDGTPFDEWRKQVKGELRNDAHAETVFRNASLRALNAGRWRQMNEKGVRDFRPYVLFDGIDDARQSEICEACDGTIVPLDSDWARSHVPPLHHRCRSSFRNLRPSEAKRRGLTTVLPLKEADDGFGAAPDDQPIWKPSPAKHDPALLRELERKEGARPPLKAVKPAPDEHDPKHWEAHYEKKYGDAAPEVAWGRAMLERGRDRSGTDVAEQLSDLRLAGHPALQGDAALELINHLHGIGTKRVRRNLSGVQNRYLVALAEHTRTIQPGDAIPSQGLPLPSSTRAFYALGLDKGVRRPRPLLIERLQPSDERRGHYSPTANAIRVHFGTPDEVFTHEVAHAIEGADQVRLQRSLAFLRARTKGELLKPLRDLVKGSNYKPDEFARPDKFLDPYVGKDYGNAHTEVTSMGYQWLSRRLDDEQLKTLIRKDPDFVLFLLGQLAGR
jgi:SPP1 gp7 family putative phage head morphogenesis protein